MENKSGIHPNEYQVLVRPTKAEDEIKDKYKHLAAANFTIADEQREREDAAATRGRIVECSYLAFTYDEWPASYKPKVGQMVIFGRYAGVSVTGHDGEEYRLINDRDIKAVVEEKQ